MRIKFKRAGFTLAEVLITLGIIGVVAAMTIPNLITKIQWIQLHSQFKHSYSTLSNAMQLLHNGEEPVPECYYRYNKDIPLTYNLNSSCAEYWPTLAKTMKVMYICTGNAYSSGCIPKYKGLEEVKKVATEEEMENFNITCSGFSSNNILNKSQVFVLIDGTIIIPYTLGSHRSSMPLFLVDINGNKGPNKWGWDLFNFQIKEAVSGSLYLTPSTSACGGIEEGGKTTQQMLTHNK